jgi:membrane-associated phospholipid phosphatase
MKQRLIQSNANEHVKELENLIPAWAKWFGLTTLTAGVILQIFAQEQNQAIFKLINSWSSLMDPDVWSFLTWLGDTTLLWPMLLPMLLKHPKAVMVALAAVPVGGCLSWLLKWSFNAPRPAGVFHLNDFIIIGPTLTEHAFPSGHTITAFAACFAVILSVKSSNTVFSKMRSALLLMSAFSIGLSRIMVGAHWPLDVLAGAGVGCISAVCGCHALERYPRLLNHTFIKSGIALILWVMAVIHVMGPWDDQAFALASVLSMTMATWGAIQYFRCSK